MKKDNEKVLKSKNKRIAILFSGGLDSTYLMWRNLKDGNVVYPIYIEIKNNKDKVIVEKQQINLIIDELKKEFPNGKIEFNKNSSSVDIVTGYFNIVSFPQPLIWMATVPFSLNDKVNELQAGYVIGDDAISSISEIKKLYNATKFVVAKYIPIKFPLIKKLKDDLMSELPDQYQKLITSCEIPVLLNIGIKQKNTNLSYRFFKPCCDCIPCKKIISHNFYGSEILKKRYLPYLYDQKMKEIKELESYKNLYMQ